MIITTHQNLNTQSHLGIGSERKYIIKVFKATFKMGGQ